MSEARPFRPATPQPFVAYRPPLPAQPARSDSPRGVWADVQCFLDRAAQRYPGTGKSLVLTARRWSAESLNQQAREWLGEWPAECTAADFDAAVSLAHECFGSPERRSDEYSLERAGLEEELWWLVPVERIDEVLDYLERVPRCTGGVNAPVQASYSCLFRLRDLETGELLPGQGSRYQPIKSDLTVYLQRSSMGRLSLMLPVPHADDALASYVVALQEYAPLWLDPRYFDHMVPATDMSRYDRTRLPPDWIGLTASGSLRLDPARSGITPVKVDLPTDAELAAEDSTLDDAPFHANYASVEAALREETSGTLLIRGPRGSGKRYMVEQAAIRLGVPLHVVQTVRVSESPALAEELRAIVSKYDGRRSLLLVEVVSYASRETNAAILSQMAGRALLGIALPAGMRLIVAEDTSPSDATDAAQERLARARDEGFLTRKQSEFLSRQAARAAYREVVIEVLPSRRR